MKELKLELKGVAETEISTVTMWEVVSDDYGWPKVLIMWDITGSGGFTIGFQYNGSEMLFVDNNSKEFEEFYGILAGLPTVEALDEMRENKTGPVVMRYESAIRKAFDLGYMGDEEKGEEIGFLV